MSMAQLAIAEADLCIFTFAKYCEIVKSHEILDTVDHLWSQTTKRNENFYYTTTSVHDLANISTLFIQGAPSLKKNPKISCVINLIAVRHSSVHSRTTDSMD